MQLAGLCQATLYQHHHCTTTMTGIVEFVPRFCGCVADLIFLSKLSFSFGQGCLNSQYFCKWTNANPMKIFSRAATASKL